MNKIKKFKWLFKSLKFLIFFLFVVCINVILFTVIFYKKNNHVRYNSYDYFQKIYNNASKYKKVSQDINLSKQYSNPSFFFYNKYYSTNNFNLNISNGINFNSLNENSDITSSSFFLYSPFKNNILNNNYLKFFSGYTITNYSNINAEKNTIAMSDSSYSTNINNFFWCLVRNDNHYILYSSFLSSGTSQSMSFIVEFEKDNFLKDKIQVIIKNIITGVTVFDNFNTFSSIINSIRETNLWTYGYQVIKNNISDYKTHDISVMKSSITYTDWAKNKTSKAYSLLLCKTIVMTDYNFPLVISLNISENYKSLLSWNFVYPGSDLKYFNFTNGNPFNQFYFQKKTDIKNVIIILIIVACILLLLLILIKFVLNKIWLLYCDFALSDLSKEEKNSIKIIKK